MKNYLKLNTSPFWIIHLLYLLVLMIPFQAKYVFMALGLYFFRMFFVTAGYHRYFSHRSFSTSRFFQFLLAFGAMTSSQKGVLWWAAHHRDHHRSSDQPEDVHTPHHHGFWWAHMGWFLSDEHTSTDNSRVKDLLKFPELVWLDRFWFLPVAVYGVGVTLIWGLPGFVWGFCISTVLLWHGTFTINSLSHLWGSRRYETNDQSRNNAFLALITLGEGWHNNHHRFPKSTRNGLKWWEYDMTYYILKILSWLNVVRNLSYSS